MVATAVADLLADSAALVARLRLTQLDTPRLHRLLLQARAQAERLRVGTDPEERNVLRRVVQRVQVGPDAVALHLSAPELFEWSAGELADAVQSDPALVLTIPVKLKRRGSELKLVLTDRPEPIRSDRSLITALARGFGWYEELRTGAAPSLGAIAIREKVSPNLVRRHIDLALLPTDLVEAIAVGRHPGEITSGTFKGGLPAAGPLVRTETSRRPQANT